MRDMDASTQMKRDKKNPILNIGFPAKTHHLQEGQTFTEFEVVGVKVPSRICWSTTELDSVRGWFFP